MAINNINISTLFGETTEGPSFQYAWKAINQALEGKWGSGNYTPFYNFESSSYYTIRNNLMDFIVYAENIDGEVLFYMPEVIKMPGIIKIFENNGGVITETNKWLDANELYFSYTFNSTYKYIVKANGLLV